MFGFNLFMSHSWSADSEDRSTHGRVRTLSRELGKLGWKVWFDEDQLLLGGNLDKDIVEGIRDSDAVCLCITRSYLEKINSQTGNCAKEFSCAQHLSKKVLPVIMEPDMLDVRNWPPGVISMYLANTFYFDCTGDNLREHAQKLSKMLALLGLTPRARLRLSVPMPSILSHRGRSGRIRMRI